MRAISLPFRIDSYGKVTSTTDMSKIWADRVRGVIATSFGERLLRPNFGCPTAIQLFTDADAVATVLETDIATAFAKWLPDLTFLGLEYEADPESSEVNIQVMYETPAVFATDASVNFVVEVN